MSEGGDFERLLAQIMTSDTETATALIAKLRARAIEIRRVLRERDNLAAELALIERLLRAVEPRSTP